MLGTLSYAITVTTAPLNSKLNEAKQSMKGADKTMKSTGKNIAQSSKKMSATAGGAIAPMEQGLSAINPAAGSAVQGMKSMSIAAKGLNAALGPIGLVVGAIGIAIAALTSYFKGSVDGQEKMAKIMGHIKGVAMVLKDAMIELGRWIAKAFEDPQQAVKDLWEIIKQNMVNRFQGMIGMVQAGWKVISSGAKGAALAVKGIFNKDAREESKKYFDEAGKASVEFAKMAAQAATGVENIYEKIGGALDHIKDKSNEIADLDVRAIKLRQKIADESVKIAKMDAKIAEGRRIAVDEQIDINKRIKAQENAMGLVEDKNKILLAQKQEELAIQIARNEAGESNIEDLEAQRKLEKEIFEISRSQESEMKRLLRRYETLRKEKESGTEAEQDALDKEKEKRAEILTEIEKSGQSEIEQIKETMNAKLEAFDWSESERVKIVEHYQGMIDAIRQEEIDKEKEARQAILDTIRESGMSEVELMKQKQAEMLEAHNWTEEEKYNITKYWDDKITEAKKESADQNISIFDDMAGGFGGLAEDMGANYAQMAAEGKEFDKETIRQALNAVIAHLIKGIMSSVPFPANIALALGAGVMAKGIFSAVGLEHGGIIPPGYSNDTYPAMLSSGETVTPPIPLSQQKNTRPQVVVFEIAGRTIEGLMKSQEEYNQSY